jgi:DNA-binding transcriptional regulator YiaG
LYNIPVISEILILNKENKMPNYTAVLNEEIARIARKEVKAAVEPLTARIIEQKKKISALNKQIAEQDKIIAIIEELLGFEEVLDTSDITEEEVEKSRITPKYVSKLRAKHELSRNDMAFLLDINPNSIYLWESGRATPRKEAKAKLLKLKKMGKKEVKRLLEEVVI